MKLKQKIADSEAYIDTDYSTCMENPLVTPMGVVIFDFRGPLLFINSSMFRAKFFEMIGKHVIESGQTIVHSVIFDCSSVTYIDLKGVEMLEEMANLLVKHNVKLVLASCNEIVYRNLEKGNFFTDFDRKHCYLTVHDAFVDVATRPKTLS